MTSIKHKANNKQQTQKEGKGKGKERQKKKELLHLHRSIAVSVSQNSVGIDHGVMSKQATRRQYKRSTTQDTRQT